MKGEAVRLERSVYIPMYLPYIISTEIDIYEIAPSRRKRSPRVYSANANRSKMKKEETSRNREIKFENSERSKDQ